MKGSLLYQTWGSATLWMFLIQKFLPCNSDLEKVVDLNRDIISTEYSSDFHAGLSTSYNNVAIYANITNVLKTAPDTGRGFIIPQNRIIFIRIKSEPHFYSVLASINRYSTHVSKWRLTYVLQIRREYFPTNLAKYFEIYTKIDIASRIYLEFGANDVFEMYFVKERLFLKDLVRHGAFTLSPSGFMLSESDISRRKDFRGVLVNGVTQDDKDLDLIATFENTTVPKFSTGLSVSYFELMAYGLNFSVGAVRGTGWISPGPDGTLLGMAQQLLSGQADVLIAHSELLPYRLRGLKFLHPYYRGRVRAFFKQPELSTIRNIFFQPLQPPVWGCLFILWLLLVGSLRGAFALRHSFLAREKISGQRKLMMLREYQGGKNDAGQRVTFNDQILVRDAFLWAISTACGQGWHILPHSGSLKLIMLSGLTTYIFSYTAYSAAILTSLSIFLVPIKNWGDLSGWSGYVLYGDVLFQSGEQFAYLNNASNKSPASSSVGDFSPNPHRVMSVTDALLRFQRNEAIALISVFDQFYQIAGKANYSHEFLCNTVSKVSVDGHEVKGGMIIRQDSPFNKYFNFITLMIQERGLDDRLSHHYSNKWSPGCLERGQRRGKYVLEINDVFTAFAILLVGFVLSGGLILVEKWSVSSTLQKNCSLWKDGMRVGRKLRSRHKKFDPKITP